MLGIAIVGLLLFLILASVIGRSELSGIDRPIMLFVYQFRTPLFTAIMKWITFFGNTGLIFVVLLAALTLLAKRYLKQALWFLILAGSGGAANAILKMIIARPRPALAPLIKETDFSFPSGHAMDSLIVYGAIAYLLLQLMPEFRYRALVIPMASLIITAIGFSRVYLGVHYPSDVLAGYLFGCGWLMLGFCFSADLRR
jgi:undecaprenyl-diphosphatase